MEVYTKLENKCKKKNGKQMNRSTQQCVLFIFTWIARLMRKEERERGRGGKTRNTSVRSDAAPSYTDTLSNRDEFNSKPHGNYTRFVGSQSIARFVWVFFIHFISFGLNFISACLPMHTQHDARFGPILLFTFISQYNV